MYSLLLISLLLALHHPTRIQKNWYLSRSFLSLKVDLKCLHRSSRQLFSSFHPHLQLNWREFCGSFNACCQLLNKYETEKVTAARLILLVNFTHKLKHMKALKATEKKGERKIFNCLVWLEEEWKGLCGEFKIPLESSPLCIQNGPTIGCFHSF